jgi:hypothetical protein
MPNKRAVDATREKLRITRVRRWLDHPAIQKDSPEAASFTRNPEAP